MDAIYRFKGVTLLELLAVLSIVSVLVAMAVPGFQSLIESNRAKVVRQQMQGLLNEARSYALKRSEVVTICHLADDNRCAANFNFPLTMFVDNDRGAILTDGSDVLRVLDMTLPDHLEMDWNRNGYIRYWPSGGTGALTGSLRFCNRFEDRNDFRIVIARTGRTRIEFDDTRC